MEKIKMAEFDFKKLTASLFDYVGPNFPVWWAQNKEKFELPDLMGIGEELLYGKKFFTTLTLKGIVQQEPLVFEEFTLPNEPLISISLAKTIVETATVGKYRKGTVKEYITTEDYQITLRGVCVNEVDFNKYPSEQVAELRRFFEINDSLEVIGNKFFELFGIRSIVLKEISLDEMAGQQGLQKYVITAVSDNDFFADLDERETFLNS